jgi:hypothetical protein
MKNEKRKNERKNNFIMSRIAGLLYSLLLIGSAVFIHLMVSGCLNLRIEFIYIIIGLLIGSGILLILQLFLKKI